MQQPSLLKYYLLLTGLCFFLSISFSLKSFAQKRPVLTEEEQVQEAVTKEVDAIIKSDDFIKKKNKKFKDVKGYIVVDIGVVQNGKLSSFFKVDSDIKNIDFIEYVSDLLLKQKFEFKLPKQQRYKIRQTIAIE
ncbi:hypothetical protein WG904_04610 [Pedobacter sp. Du54]|uniref:hypothetical protein n=1 Tax=Pedobacter anseongensis TaxID=3133439 RepID=UPI0030ACE196